ncbi:hypothetical protein [Mycoplasma sp. 'Moose RK']|uniref:hypothetical protein n=1 Tax=Mycoplasma sp. 'Moose RK' TaxID=2780095 RepID=UPI0018C33F9A|nr:hypothetical protein [Mycoplasma sp. 'Moose RK']MBG0730526.1 hypothetical protein [Mycoplasma sp. 'Moose RK']
MTNFDREEKKELVFHNIKNNYWNYFSLKIRSNQNSFLYSSDLNFFNEFKKILEQENSYNGFIIEENKPYDFEKKSCFSDFLTKKVFEESKNKLVIEVLFSYWKINSSQIKTNTTRKYILSSMIEHANNFLQLVESEINFLIENQAQNFDLLESIKQIKEKYKILNQNFHNLYTKAEINPINEQENCTEISKANSFFFDFEIDNSKNSEINAENAVILIKNDIKNIVNHHNSLLNSFDVDPYKIKIFLAGYSCFSSLIKESSNFRWLSSQQIYETYYEFESWLGKLLNQKTLESLSSVKNHFSKTFADKFWIFWQQNRDQKILENRNKKTQKHFKIKKNHNFRRENPYYQNLKSNNKTVVRANILWQQEIIRIKKKQYKKKIENSFLSKRVWLISIENKLKKLQDKISKLTHKNDFIFLKDAINDLKYFFVLYNLNKIDLFHKKNQFLIFCFENGIDFDLLYQNYGNLSNEILFFLETKKLKMGNYTRILFDESSFFLENAFKQKLLQHCFTAAKNPVQLFVFSRRPIKPIRDFSIIFIEKGVLVEYISEIDLPLTPKTTYAKFFYQNSGFDTANLHLLETQLYRQLQNNVFVKNQGGIHNNFELFVNQWNPSKSGKFKLNFSIKKEWLTSDILIVDLK